MSSTRRSRRNRPRSRPEPVRHSRTGGRGDRSAQRPPGPHDWLLDYRDDVLAAQAAESRGDAATALEVMQARPLTPDGAPFWRPWRVHALTQLVCFGDCLPGWVISRWIVDQAHSRMLAPDDARLRRALAIAVGVRRGEADLPGVDDVDPWAQVLDQDWIFRQVYLYELGGLDDFLCETASPNLIASADRIHEWVEAPLSAFRLEQRGVDTLTWTDLATGAEVETPNLGGAVLARPGQSALARLVPVNGGTIFESAPLWVQDEVASAVAERPANWLLALSVARAGGAEIQSRQAPTGLVVDVPPAVWQLMVASPLARGEVPDLLKDSFDDDGPEEEEDPDDLDKEMMAAHMHALEPRALACSLVELVHVVAEFATDDARSEGDRPAGQGPEATVGDDVGPDSAPCECETCVGSVDIWSCLAAAICDPWVLGALGNLLQPTLSSPPQTVDPSGVRRALDLLSFLLPEPAAQLCCSLLKTSSETIGAPEPTTPMATAVPVENPPTAPHRAAG